MTYSEIVELVLSSLNQEYAGVSYQFNARADKFEQMTAGAGAVVPVEAWRDNCHKYMRFHIVICDKSSNYTSLEFLSAFIISGSGYAITDKSEIGIYASPVGQAHDKNYIVMEITVKADGGKI